MRSTYRSQLGQDIIGEKVVMEVLFLAAVCCVLPVLVAIGMSVPKLLVMIGMSLSKKIPKRANEC